MRSFTTWYRVRNLCVDLVESRALRISSRRVVTESWEGGKDAGGECRA